MKEGAIKVYSISFQVYQKMLAEITSLALAGEVITHDNHNLKAEQVKFNRGDPELPREKQGAVARSSLSELWSKVTWTIMHYITLDNIDIWLRSFHFAFLNHVKGHKMNILDQGLNLMVFKHKANQMGVVETFRLVDPNVCFDDNLEGHTDGGGPKRKKRVDSEDEDWHAGKGEPALKQKQYPPCKRSLRYVAELNTDPDELTIVEKTMQLLLEEDVGREINSTRGK